MELSYKSKYVMNAVYPGTVTGVDLNAVQFLIDQGQIKSLAQAYRLTPKQINQMWLGEVLESELDR